MNAYETAHRPISPTEDPANARNRKDLARCIAAGGGNPTWQFFWGHRSQPDGTIGAGCLSQWWHCRFTIEGIDYKSTEHWMMAAKGRLFGDHDTCAQILAAPAPAEAKALGRQVKGFDEDVWAACRSDIVMAGNLAKFDQNPALRTFLLTTGNSVLVEASPFDRIWGIGLGAGHRLATDPARWPGLNLLGFALMDVRSRLAA